MMWGLGIVLAGFFVTIVIELIVAFLFRFSNPNELKTVALATVITYPILSLFLLSGLSVAWSYNNFSLFIILLEFIVVAVEFLILYYVFKSKYSWKYLFLISLTMNAASYGFGLLLF